MPAALDKTAKQDSLTKVGWTGDGWTGFSFDVPFDVALVGLTKGRPLYGYVKDELHDCKGLIAFRTGQRSFVSASMLDDLKRSPVQLDNLQPCSFSHQELKKAVEGQQTALTGQETLT